MSEETNTNEKNPEITPTYDITVSHDEDDERTEYTAGRLRVWAYLDLADIVIDTADDGYAVKWEDIPTLITLLNEIKGEHDAYLSKQGGGDDE